MKPNSLKKLYEFSSNIELLSYLNKSKTFKVHRAYELWYQNLPKEFKGNPKVLVNEFQDLKARPDHGVIPLSRAPNGKIVTACLDFIDEKLWNTETPDLMEIIFHYSDLARTLHKRFNLDLISKRYFLIEDENVKIEEFKFPYEGTLIKAVVDSKLPYRGKILKAQKDEKLFRLLNAEACSSATIIPHLENDKVMGVLILWDQVLPYSEVMEYH